jgi:hypothetical protein
MRFNDAAQVESLAYEMRLAEYQRGLDRARINNLFNGHPPYTADEVNQNNIAINVNFLEPTRLAHDGRSQFYNAFLKPGKFFSCITDSGAKHKRQHYGSVVTREITRKMKRSLLYFEKQRSTFASDVLHGIGPGVWENCDMWCPMPVGIEDILIPSNTLLTMQNVPFFIVYRSFTAPELIRLAKAPHKDPGWNQPLVDSVLEWVDRETMALLGTAWPDVWSPEKMAERLKSDGTIYAGDAVPTIDCYDFYFRQTEQGLAGTSEQGWMRRIVLDAWSEPAASSGRYTMARKGDRGMGIFSGPQREFLYTSGDKKYADKMSEIVAFQFADLSSVAPFKYHSVRSLGYLLYAVCHLQNRLRCKVSAAVFETLMMLFRVKSMEDVQQALHLNLFDRGFIDETLSPVPANERWQVNEGLVQFGLSENAKLISANAGSYAPQPNMSADRTEKTKFQVMAELNNMTALVAAALNQAYFYQNFENREILRRFFIKDSSDPEVRDAQAKMLRQGLPEKLLDIQCWETEPERVMGAGNKTMEMTIAQMLMETRDKFDPEPQRKILHDFVLAISDDPGRADALVPEEPVRVTDSVHDAQLAAGVLMQGLPVGIKTGMNHIEYVETLLQDMALLVAQIQKSGGMATPQQILGLQNMAGHISEHIKIIAQDKTEKARVKAYGDALGKIMNMVKAFAQRLQEQAQKQNGQPQMDPKDAAKIQATMMTAKTKSDLAKQSHAQRTAQRQIQFEQDLKQKAQQHEADLQAKDLTAASEINRNRMTNMEE